MNKQTLENDNNAYDDEFFKCIDKLIAMDDIPPLSDESSSISTTSPRFFKPITHNSFHHLLNPTGSYSKPKRSSEKKTAETHEQIKHFQQLQSTRELTKEEKKTLRRIKNSQAAQQHRDKVKSQIEDLYEKNFALMCENQLLKTKVAQLEAHLGDETLCGKNHKRQKL